MKTVELISDEYDPIFKDDEGNEYTYGGDRDEEELCQAIDSELSFFGLELYVGDVGSSDTFVCVTKRKEL